MKKRIVGLFMALALLLGVFFSLTTPADAAATYYWPVPGHTSLSRGYFDGHEAIDIHDSNINGATVIASVGGTVYRAYTCTSQHYGDMHTCGGFGTGLVIKGDDGWYYQYAHMQANSLTVSLGQYVPAGTAIGRVGTTGNSSGPHLHFGIASNSNWWETKVNPQSLTFNYAVPGANYLNLGENFYAYIKFPSTGHGVCNVNNNIQLGAYGTQSSLWNFIRQSDGSYKIVSAVNGTVMDVSGGNSADETNLQTYANNDTIAQRFYIQAAGNAYNIIAANCGKAVDVKDGSNSVSGTNVHIFSQNGSADQKFEINPLNWIQQGSDWYYNIDGKYATGWQLIDGAWYIFNDSGKMITGWALSNGTYYYMGSSGAMVTGWQLIDGVWYYFKAGGAMATGWEQVGDVWYYFTNSGAMATGWQLIDGAWYYLKSGGAMVTGWQQIGGVWYYFTGSGAMATGWQLIGGSWYYLGSNGAMVTGWQFLDGHWYYLNAEGYMHTGWLLLDGQWYGFNSSGHMITGWATYQGDDYYFAPNGTMVTGSHYIDGAWYYFAPNGALVG